MKSPAGLMEGKMSRLALRLAAAVLALSALASPAALAQGTAWPTKPVKFIVPFPPGGSVDPLGRLLAVKLTESLNQQFIVENKTGASGSIGTAFVAKSAPDGYTFVVVFDTHAVNPSLIPNLPFDTLKDLAPVMVVGTSPMVIVTNAGKPYKTFADVIAAAKAKPGTISYGTVGAGSLGHLTMTLLEQAAGIKLIHVPYKGGGPMTTDALGGQIDLGIASVAQQAQHVKGGKLRGIAVTGDARSQVLPDVPALAESGFPGFSALAWWGIFAPAGTPKPILDKFHAELVKALNRPEVKKQLSESLGMDITASTPEDTQKFVITQMERWGKVVRDNNIRME
jgi:tripartite-type tricarboxylate transporter receptor subunit TctC